MNIYTCINERLVGTPLGVIAIVGTPLGVIAIGILGVKLDLPKRLNHKIDRTYTPAV